jgi:hypothetical protein
MSQASPTKPGAQAQLLLPLLTLHWPAGEDGDPSLACTIACPHQVLVSIFFMTNHHCRSNVNVV